MVKKSKKFRFKVGLNMLLLALIFKSHILNLNFIILLWKRGVIRKLIYVSQIKLIFK